MYMIETRQAPAELRTQTEMDGILKALISKNYVPALRSGAAAIFKSCGASINICDPECANIVYRMFGDPSTPARYGRTLEIVGDIFFYKNNMIALQPRGRTLYVLEIREHLVTSHLSDFCQAVADGAASTIDGRRLRGMSFEWIEPPPARRRIIPVGRNRALARPMSDLTTKPAELSDELVGDSNLLVNRERRDFLVRLAQLGKARATDAQADVEAGHVSPLIERGLVRKEFLVLCKRDSHTICTVETREQLAAESSRKILCSICGRPFSEETIQEIYALTGRARKMLDGSHWMTVWVTSILVESGIPLGQILWGATSGEDEIDIIVTVRNQSIFFELKDRMFGLGDAYPFTARVQRYGANAGVIISMEGVADEVGKFLSEQSRSLGRAIYAIAGEREVRTEVPAMLLERAQLSVAEGLKEVFYDMGLNPAPIFEVWSKKKQKTLR